MTEELKTCDFYNEKICTLFSKYFGFNVECKNLFLSTIDCDIERECPIKRLEQENKELKEMYRLSCLKCEYKNTKADVDKYRSALDTIQKIVLSAWEQGKYLDGGLYNDLMKEFAKINEVLK